MRYLLLITIVIIASCNKRGKFKVKNDISELRWGDENVGGFLLPGELSSTTEVMAREKEFPMTNKLSFVMSANGKQILVSTQKLFTLEQDDDVIWVLSDSLLAE